jgi:glutamine phosphoribosylpyrophosphate amidotransferase
MCGIFGIVASDNVSRSELKSLATHARQRGRDSSGIVNYSNENYSVEKADFDVKKLLKQVNIKGSKLALGHSRLITNGLKDNQPVIREDVIVIHNGIIVNDEEIWSDLTIERKFKIDSEVINAIALECLEQGVDIDEIPSRILAKCKGVVACALLLPKLGKLLIFSNNGSLYFGESNGSFYFASESFALKQLGLQEINQVFQKPVVKDVPASNKEVSVKEYNSRKLNLVPELGFNKEKESLLDFSTPNLKRCTKCILPETMPFIHFDNKGVCNYCNSYKPKNQPKPKEELFQLVEKYRRKNGPDCIVPFSGGRDSCYGLHLIVKN